MTRGPQRIHHVLPDMAGLDHMETLCNRLVVPQRDSDDKIIGFTTSPALNHIQCVFDSRDVTCNTCQHVWRNISRPEYNGKRTPL